MKKIIVPGDRIADKEVSIPNTYFEEGATYAEVIGVLDETGRYIALETKYAPIAEDVVVGIVVGLKGPGYMVDVKLPNYGFIPSRDLRGRLNVGDMIIGKIKMIRDSRDVDIYDIKKLPMGKLVEFPNAKIARLIGKKSSMINLITDAIQGELVVGTNGYIWVSEQANIPLFTKALDFVRKNAHTSGLTDKMTELLKTG